MEHPLRWSHVQERTAHTHLDAKDDYARDAFLGEAFHDLGDHHREESLWQRAA